jgi:YD repeat-containing protein
MTFYYMIPEPPVPNIFFPYRSATMVMFCIFFSAIILPSSASAADRLECAGFGGSKFCFEPDNPPLQGNFISDLTYYNACEKIGIVGVVSNGGGESYEIVPLALEAPPTLKGPTLMVNYCILNGPTGEYVTRVFMSSARCSSGSEMIYDLPRICVPAIMTQEKDLGKNCDNMCGNPINYATGNKFQEEVDYRGVADLSFVRSYNHMPGVNVSSSNPFDMGANWRHNFKYVVKITGFTPNVAKVYRPDGRAYGFFNAAPISSTSNWIPESDIKDTLKQLADLSGTTVGWEYKRAADDAIETYGADGQINSLKLRNGQIQTFTYSDISTPTVIAPIVGLLIRVTDHFGRSLNFQYDQRGRIIKMTDPVGGEYLYGYGEASSIKPDPPTLSSNLTSVTYPGGKKKIYWYNEQNRTSYAAIPSALTGITDENGARFASFNYDANMRAISTEHAGGVEKYSVTYDIPLVQSTVTEPLGTRRIYGLTGVVQLVRSSGQYQSNAAGTGIKARTYDAGGNVTSTTDFNNFKTNYVYDLARNLETGRTEAAGTPQARTVATQWHPDFRLPVLVTEPGKVTSFAYDASGNLLQKTLAAGGASRTWADTYNNIGQVLTVTGPRTDVADVTTYAYDAQGNLSTVTNAAGQATTLSNYDANGRAGRITDPNGLATDLTYSPRGWLTSKNVGGEATSYSYDGIGQLTGVTLPDASTLAYTYDDAHRLTRIADGAGNSVAYTLDAIGNRVNEKITDPDGVLARETIRVYDTLNRLQQITGGMQ